MSSIEQFAIDEADIECIAQKLAAPQGLTDPMDAVLHDDGHGDGHHDYHIDIPP